MILFLNREYKLEVGLVGRNGNFVSGSTISYTIYKSDDNSLIQSGTMNEIGTSGVYQLSVTFSEVGQYRVEYITPISYENSIDTIFVKEADFDDLDTQIKRILGLSQENYRIFNTSYDARNNLLSGLIKIYSSASDVDTDTNPIAQYQINAVFNRRNRMTSYKVKKVA